MEIVVGILVIVVIIMWIYLVKIKKEAKQLLLLQGRCERQRCVIEDLRIMLYMSSDWKQVERYMLDQGFTRIAIYGMGILGQEFVRQMKNTQIKICYGIDKNNKNLDMEVRRPNEAGNDVDIIIVTAELDYVEIRKQLSEIVKVPVVLLSDFLEEIMSIPKIC